ncbi:hypothetical protein FRB95_000303 [Tulasnella sp. JGI-2019a]|nr:hypothetical protein FRB95_000303 [Tulasnella sp. JGI-2019a]
MAGTSTTNTSQSVTLATTTPRHGKATTSDTITTTPDALTSTTTTPDRSKSTTTPVPAVPTSIDPISQLLIPSNSIAQPTSSGVVAGDTGSSGISAGVKALIGVIVGLIVLALAAAGAFWYLRRKWNVRAAASGGAGVRRQWSLYEATSVEDHDADPERDGAIRDQLKEGESLGLYDGGATLTGKTTRTSRRSSTGRSRYTRVGKQRTSIGLDLEPEAYAMFGASTTSLERYTDDDPRSDPVPPPPGLGSGGEIMEMGQRKPSPEGFDPTDPKGKRRSADNGPGLAGMERQKRLSLLEDQSRYPTVSSQNSGAVTGRRLSRTITGSGSFDPFSDAAPTAGGSSPPAAQSASSPPKPPLGALGPNPFRK